MPPHLIIMDSCFVSDFFKMKCDHQNPVYMHTSIMCTYILQIIKAVAPKL
jgi:hypothetical protein